MIDLTRERVDIQATYIPNLNSGCESRYELHEGLLVIPVLGEPTDPPVIARIHSPYTTRVSGFSYAKVAAPPQIPSPGNTRTGHMFLGGSISLPAPSTSGEGILTYATSGLYNFVLPTHATTSGKTIMFDAHPYPSGVDMLGATQSQSDNPADPEYGQFYNSWQYQYFALDKLTSFRILG